MNKRGALIEGTAAIILVVTLLVVFVGLPLTGILKFVFFTDKTPLIIIAFIILIILFGQKKREARRFR
jgi:cytochrome c biogenesis protein CcdA